MTKDDVIKMLGGVLVAAQEPEAWMGYEGGYKKLTSQRQIADAYPEIYTIPLYAHPPAAQPEQEPVAFINAKQRTLEWAKPTSWNTPTVVNLPKIPLYTSPQRPWVDLTDEEIQAVAKQARSKDHAVTLANKLLKEKNNG